MPERHVPTTLRPASGSHFHITDRDNRRQGSHAVRIGTGRAGVTARHPVWDRQPDVAARRGRTLCPKDMTCQSGFGLTMLTAPCSNAANARQNNRVHGGNVRRDHPPDPWSDEGFQGLHGCQRGRPGRAPGDHPCPDRAEWCRQDDLLQPAHQVPHPDPGNDHLQGAGHHPHQAGGHRPPRPRALVPDLRRLPAHDGAGERAHRPAAQAR